MEFTNVTASAAANVYFDGKVVSHAIVTSDGARRTLGVIMPGEYHFDTGAAELMEIVKGSCEVAVDGAGKIDGIDTGSSFEVGSNSGFTITVSGEPCHYVCSFL